MPARLMKALVLEQNILPPPGGGCMCCGTFATAAISSMDGPVVPTKALKLPGSAQGAFADVA